MAKKIQTVQPKVTKPAKPKKLSKKQQLAAKWAPQHLANQASNVMKGILGDMRTEYGDANIAPVAETGRIVIGAPLPSFAMEYLLTTTVFPLGRLLQLVGAEGTMKSGFCFEVVRWIHQRCKGTGFLLENESKFSPLWPQSIIGWDAPPAVLGHVPTTSVEDWQQKMQMFILNTKKAMLGSKEEPGPGRVWASVIILDSLMGKLSEETIKAMEKDGHANRHYATEAARISEFLKKIASDVMEWPLAFIAVNHLKMSKDDRNLPVRGKAGGKLISFQETFELEMSKKSSARIMIAATPDQPEIRGKHLNIKCFKNSLGEDRRDIDVDVMWWHERNEKTGQMQQITIWDWYGSTTKLLVHTEWSAGQRDRIRDIVDLNRVTKQGAAARIWSKRLGIPKSDPQEYHDIGKAIQRDKEVLEALRGDFGVYPGRRFLPGIDYLQQLNQLRADVDKDIEEAQRAAETKPEIDADAGE